MIILWKEVSLDLLYSLRGPSFIGINVVWKGGRY